MTHLHGRVAGHTPSPSPYAATTYGTGRGNSHAAPANPDALPARPHGLDTARSHGAPRRGAGVVVAPMVAEFRAVYGRVAP